MTADAAIHPLAAWRAIEGLSPRAAARRLAISIDAVTAIEAGTAEPGPSLVIDIFHRTGGAVLLGADASDGAPGAATPRWGAIALPGADPQVWMDRAGGGDGKGWFLSPDAAAELGMQLIRAALAARQTDGGMQG